MEKKEKKQDKESKEGRKNNKDKSLPGEEEKKRIIESTEGEHEVSK